MGYKASGFSQALAAAVPNGIDIYFENVGGAVLEAVVPLLNKGCRVPICGFISQYESSSFSTPMERLKAAGLPKMSKKGGADGFRFFFWSEPRFLPRRLEALRQLSGWVKEGKIKY